MREVQKAISRELVSVRRSSVSSAPRRSAEPPAGHDLRQVSVHPRAPAGIQVLSLGPSDDAYEREAERAAEQVMRAGVPRVDAPEHSETTRFRASPATGGQAPPIVDEVLRSPGQSLDPATRTFMEPRFGHDFGAVRVHTDARAAESAQAVDAVAYTVGRDVVFGRGHYDPASTRGRSLLAHELTHVVQQNQGPGQAGARIMRQPNTGAAGGSSTRPAAKGPYLLPDVKVGQAPVDVTFVKVETGEEALRRMSILNEKAEAEFLEQARRSRGTISAAGPEAAWKAKQTENDQVKQTLKTQFGECWGTVFWWTRGGGQTGEGSPVWDLLEGLSGLNRSVPIPRPGGEPVYRDTRGTATPTESTR